MSSPMGCARKGLSLRGDGFCRTKQSYWEWDCFAPFDMTSPDVRGALQPNNAVWIVGCMPASFSPFTAAISDPMLDLHKNEPVSLARHGETTGFLFVLCVL